MIEINPFRYFLPSKPQKLIIGSFPCFNGKDYGDWFYSGSGKNHFWKLLSETLDFPAGNKEQNQTLCEKFGIAITDVAYKVERKRGNCSDANLKIIEFNKTGIDKCLNSGINAIFFTGKLVEKEFKKHYPDIEIASVVLLSPSPAANMHIGGLEEYKYLKNQKSIASPYDYRLLKYRELLLK
jgi:hypoxanthine-DNA glycosylase